MKNYPLKIKPVTKSAIWGGSTIPERFGIGNKGENVAEGWMLTVRPDAVNLIENGACVGMTLAEYLGLHPENEGISTESEHFPLLVKLIDAHDKLSVQVHPDDMYAALNGLDAGKTEMWYILDAAEGAELVMGIRGGVSKETLREHALNGTLEDDLVHVKVKKGDSFFIPAGLVHAIGGGILIAEIQQNSDTTYRLYDYDRVGKDGKKRELHLENALDTVKTQFDLTGVSVNTPVSSPRGVSATLLCGCDKFKATKVCIDAGRSFGIASQTHFLHVMCVGGFGHIECDGVHYPLVKGDSYFLPAYLPGLSFVSERPLTIIISET